MKMITITRRIRIITVMTIDIKITISTVTKTELNVLLKQ